MVEQSVLLALLAASTTISFAAPVTDEEATASMRASGKSDVVIKSLKNLDNKFKLEVMAVSGNKEATDKFVTDFQLEAENVFISMIPQNQEAYKGYNRSLNFPKMPCLVCGSPQSEPHFGGFSCRACAAFFRRYFTSKKLVVGCVCKTKSPNSHPCRGCRVAKCFAVGMKSERIQRQRDCNGSQPKPKIPSPEFKQELPSISNSPTFRTTINISLSIPIFSNYDEKRFKLYPRPGTQNLYEATSLTKNDVNLTCDMIMEAFPEFQKLSHSDRKSLLHNFMIKIWNLDPILDDVANREKAKKMNDEEIRNYMFPMFDGCFMKGAELGKEDLWRIFGIYWKAYFERLVHPVVDLRLDQFEFVALLWILFFDHAYINISEPCSKFCWNLRKVMLQELKNYELEKNLDAEDADSRFLEILEVLLIVERSDQQFCEEMILYEMNKLRMHDDFKAIVKRQRI